MKITLFTVEKPPTVAGDSKNAFHFATELCNQGINAEVAYLKKNKNKQIENYTVKYLKLPFYAQNYSGKILYYIFLPFFLFARHHRSNIWLIYGGLAGNKTIILIGRLLKIKVILRSTLLGFDDLEFLSHSGRCPRIDKHIYNKLWGYWALTKELCSNARNCFPQINTATFSQGVPQRYFMVDNKVTTKATMTVAMVGHVIERKGFPEIFDWFNCVDGSPILLIIGNNMSETKLVERGKVLLGTRVRFTGVVDDPLPFLKKADIFLHASQQEGFPNALAEAMAMGLPCIVRNFMGANSYLHHNINCLLYETKEEFTGNLQQLIQSKEERARIGNNAKHDAENYFKLDLAVKQFLEFVSASENF